MKGNTAALICFRVAAWRRGVLLALLLLAALCVRAGEATLEDGARFDVRSAFLEPAERVYQLNATLDLALSRNAQGAIRDGVPVVLELDLGVNRKRRYLPDEKVAALAQRWQLHYHALSERYIVNNLNSGQQASYLSLSAALAALSEVRGLPVIDEALIDKADHYEASMRVQSTIEGGLPSALRTMMFWMDWKRTTDWYTWTLPP
ncbi:MAG: DUF4390 domain-containing protein [Pseudomonadota bacterium]|nr:DUF4390 domain-containing protein [Pseudomonadota bacterium]